jgi:TIR domain/Domain of unknown function (DUF4384)
MVSQSVRVFLSYSSRDRSRVVELARAFENTGLIIWRDQNEILGGQNYGPKIVDAIRASQVLLLCCSRNSVGSKNVKQEVQLAWSNNVPFLPLLLDGVTDFAQLQYWLQGIQYVDVSKNDEKDWLPRVIRAVENLSAGSESAQPALAAAARSASDLGLSALRALARFTDRIWPERYARMPGPVTRDLGAVPGSAAYQFRRGEHVVLRLELETAGHAIVLDQGTSGKTYCLCPSRFSPTAQFGAGLVTIPQANARYPYLEVSGPPGYETLLAILADAPPPFDLMPRHERAAALELAQADIAALSAWLHELPPERWQAIATEFEILP